MDKKIVLKALGINILSNLPIRKDVEVIGTINGFFIYPCNYYWVVAGKMPLRYADELYEFRDNLGIRVAGGSNSNKPIDWSTSDEYEKYKNEQTEQIELIGMDEFCNRLRNKKGQLMGSNIDNFYVEIYHVDKLEGLKKVVDIIKEYNIEIKW